MCKNCRTAYMGFTDETVPPGIHMCYIYNDDAQRRKLISRFLESGVLSGEKVSYFIDTVDEDEILVFLESIGLEECLKDHSGRFSVAAAEKTYCPSGRFVPEDMLERLRDFYRQSAQEGFGGARVSGEMSWALRGIPGSSELMLYEALVNNVLLDYPVNAICQYNANIFDGATLFDVLTVHPMMIVHGQILKNPYYVNTKDFLKEYNARKPERHIE